MFEGLGVVRCYASTSINTKPSTDTDIPVNSFTCTIVSAIPEAGCLPVAAMR